MPVAFDVSREKDLNFPADASDHLLEAVLSILNEQDSALEQIQLSMDSITSASLGKGSAVLDTMQGDGVQIPVTTITADHLSSGSFSAKEQGEPVIEVFHELNVEVVSSENTMLPPSTESFSEIVEQRSDASGLLLDDQPAVHASAASEHNVNRIAKLRVARPRLNLSPVMQGLTEMRNLIGEYRRRSRSRTMSRFRSDFSGDDSASAEVPSTVLPVVPFRHTKSKGPVPAQDNVQARPIEYK